MLTTYDLGIDFTKNSKEFIAKYLTQYGYPCSYLTQNVNDDTDKYQVAFGANKIGYSNSSNRYNKKTGYLLLDKNSYTSIVTGDDTSVTIYIPDIDKLNAGDKLEVQTMEGIVTYQIEAVAKFHDIMYQAQLKFVTRKSI